MAESTEADRLEPEAFRTLFPEQYLQRFLAANTRPDGRPLMRVRPTSVGDGHVGSAVSSAVARTGDTTFLAGVSLEVAKPHPDSPGEGTLEVAVELAPLCSPHTRPGRQSPEAQWLTERVASVLRSSGAVNLRDVCIREGQSAWVVHLDVYCLNANGSLLDTALLAAVGALARLRLPAISVSRKGRVAVRSADGGEQPETGAAGGDSGAAGDAGDGAGGKKGPAVIPAKRMALGATPVALTCGIYQGKLLADPTAEEEEMLESLITVALDEAGQLLLVHKAGGKVGATEAVLADCIEAARVRYGEVAKKFRALLAEEEEQAAQAGRQGGSAVGGSSR